MDNFFDNDNQKNDLNQTEKSEEEDDDDASFCKFYDYSKICKP